jgi:rhamnose utilization protein RhaD (predicted bifunctional aldolase and dehydrogenase)
MSMLDQLIEISRFYGDNPDYVIAGGGNTSLKNEQTIWIKASGIPLAGITEEGFVSLSRKTLSIIEEGSFSDDPVLREEEVKEKMTKAIIAPLNLRPSVETSLHNLIGYRYVVHTHPTQVNALMCAREVEKEVKERFGEQAILVEYTDPGYILFKKLQKRIAAYKAEHGMAPPIIFLQNHGVFVGADTLAEIKALYTEIDLKIKEGKDLSLPSVGTIPFESALTDSIASYFASRSLLTFSVNAPLISHFSASKNRLELISKPFSPDIIVYCKSKYLFLSPEVKDSDIKGLLEAFESKHGYYPKVIIQEGGGLTVVEENDKSLHTVLEVFLDLMKISYLSKQFGGPHFMTPEQIEFIDNWEVEHYRRKVAKAQDE